MTALGAQARADQADSSLYTTFLRPQFDQSFDERNDTDVAVPK